MAGERARLTEQESHPAFRWCDGKWNNWASVKDQRHNTLTHIHTVSPAPITQHVLAFPVSVPIWWVSWPHDESLPLLLSSVHSEDAKGSGCEGWVTSTSHPGLTPSSSSLQQHPLFDPAVSHPASSYSAVCTCYDSLTSHLLPSSLSLLKHPSRCVWIHSIARNASLDVHSPAASLRPLLNILTVLAQSLILTRGQRCYKDSERLKISLLSSLWCTRSLFV